MGYGMLSPDESHDAVDVAPCRCRLNARVCGVQHRLDHVVVGKSPVVDISQRHTDVSYVRGGHGRRHAVETVPAGAELGDGARHQRRLPVVV